MSKADTLLKKATFFERMALYSDRKAFLQSLAQTGGASGTWPSQLPSNISEGLNSLLKDLAATKPDSSVPMQNRLLNFYNGTNTDMGQLAQTIREAANMIPGDHTTQVQNALDLAGRVDQLVAQQQPQQTEVAGEPMVMPTAHIRGFTPISKADQKAVFDFATKGVGQIDGQLGRETRAALEKIKDYYKQTYPQNPRMSDQQAIQAAKFNAGKPLP